MALQNGSLWPWSRSTGTMHFVTHEHHLDPLVVIGDPGATHATAHNAAHGAVRDEATYHRSRAKTPWAGIE